MNRTTRRAALIPAAAMLALALTACSGGGDDTAAAKAAECEFPEGVTADADGETLVLDVSADEGNEFAGLDDSCVADAGFDAESLDAAFDMDAAGSDQVVQDILSEDGGVVPVEGMDVRITMWDGDTQITDAQTLQDRPSDQDTGNPMTGLTMRFELTPEG